MTGPDPFCPRCQEAQDYCRCPPADIPGDFDPGPVPPGDDDGAAVLDQAHGTLTCYVMFPSAEAGWAVTLFAAATWVMPYLEFAARRTKAREAIPSAGPDSDIRTLLKREGATKGKIGR